MHAYLFYDLKEQKEHLFAISGNNSAMFMRNLPFGDLETTGYDVIEQR